MVDIDKIKFYGWWYRQCENEYEHNWWYSLFDEQIYSVAELTEKFSFGGYDDIINADGYIPLWKTDYCEVVENFLRGLNNKEADKYFEGNPTDDGFMEFERYIENHYNHIRTWWYEYSDKRIKEDALNWCKENRIAYKK